jgi:hypothetical protein
MIYYHKKTQRWQYSPDIRDAAKALGVPEDELERREFERHEKPGHSDPVVSGTLRYEGRYLNDSK